MHPAGQDDTRMIQHLLNKLEHDDARMTISEIYRKNKNFSHVQDDARMMARWPLQDRMIPG